MGTDAWASIPWEVETEGDVTTWHKRQVPYIPQANSLQNLDIWISTPRDRAKEAPAPSEFPAQKGPWIIYIHGGAWRDPFVTSSSFEPTIKELIAKHPPILSKIAGFASINYSLSPHPMHPSSPSPPKEPGQPSDPSRLEKHPRHILDVLTALSYLQSKAGFSNNYVLLGHSCGATLAFQVAMSASKWGSDAESIKVSKPGAIVGLNGLYDMPELIREPGAKHAALQAVYEAFTRLAFGDDKKVWNIISPISVSKWNSEWVEGQKVVFVQSREDSLVPYWQLEEMRNKMLESKAEGLEIVELSAKGDHNELWQHGDRLAEIVIEVLNSLP